MGNELHTIAKAMVARGKGILAADESTGTIGRRLASINVANEEPNRQAWRQLLFTSEGYGKYISGVILYDETLRQSAAAGTPFVDILQAEGVIPGIKVDNSTNPLASAPGELTTDGLDGLRDRLNEYYELGARFTKWRAVITIGDHIPSDYCINVNAHALGRFAALSQEAGLVPIVEPEVLMDGDHSIEMCEWVTERTLNRTFAELKSQRVDLEGMVLKPNMVLSGADADDRAVAQAVARATVDCFRRTIPAAVPGIAFLSGGQGDEEATVNLDAINKIAKAENAPWELSFSYGRGLQATPLSIWGGNPDNIPAAQKAFLERSIATAAAREGEYV
jgi:fructose-bisphosphate aldolase class I